MASFLLERFVICWASPLGFFRFAEKKNLNLNVELEDWLDSAGILY